jgi:teichuronic acid biosynthesis glycosyltransferase TuaG
MVSVIIPCYNSAGCVGRAIESVLAQSFGNYEILVIDNNSTDNTLAVLNKYAAAHPEKISVHQE